MDLNPLWLTLATGLGARGHEVHVYAAAGSDIPGVRLIDTGVDPESLATTLYPAPDLRPGLTPRDVAALIVALLDDQLTIASGANIPLFCNT